MSPGTDPGSFPQDLAFRNMVVSGLGGQDLTLLNFWARFSTLELDLVSLEADRKCLLLEDPTSLNSVKIEFRLWLKAEADAVSF